MQTGLRVTELTGLRRSDMALTHGPHIRCSGKGRKKRCTPLTAHTVATLRAWMRVHQGEPDTPLFPTRRGTPLSTDAVESLVTKHAAAATARCPSLASKHVTPHVLRHAQRAAEIPFPDEDLYVPGELEQVYAWRATDMQATCASWIDMHAEAFTLCRRLLARPNLPDPDRQRIATNRDFSVPAMIEAASPYPEALAQSLAASPSEAEATVSSVAGPDRETTEQTLNSFLTCCLDVSRVGRFWCSTPACPPPTAPSCSSATDSSSLPIAAPATGPPPNWRRSALRSTDGSGCTWAKAGGFSPPRTSSPA